MKKQLPEYKFEATFKIINFEEQELKLHIKAIGQKNDPFLTVHIDGLEQLFSRRSFKEYLSELHIVGTLSKMEYVA